MNEEEEEDYYLGNYRIYIPKLATPAALSFLKEYSRFMEFLKFTIENATSAWILEGKNPDDWELQDEEDNQELVKEDWDTRLLGSHEQFMAEMLLTRAVDNFLVYLKDLLVLIFRTKPETLRSGEEETLEFILQFQTMEDLISALAEKRVNQYSYKGLKELSDFFEKRLKLSLFQPKDVLEQVTLINELRNLIVHNRGIADSRFKRSYHNHPANVGERVVVSYKTIIGDIKSLASAVFEIDKRAAAKLKLPQTIITREVLAEFLPYVELRAKPYFTS